MSVPRFPLDGLRRHKLITAADSRRLPAIYTQDGKGFDAIAYVKLFCPWSRYTLYVTEFDGTDQLFGYTVSPLGPDCDEWGYSSLAQLARLALRTGTPAIERDQAFEPTPVGECDYVTVPPSARNASAGRADDAGSSAEGTTGRRPAQVPTDLVRGLEFTTGGDAVGQEYQGYIIAVSRGREIGRLDYTYFDGELGIRMIQVNDGLRREGVATALLERMKEEDPDCPVFSFGNVMTPDGKAWLDHHGIERWS
jgi:hypothetical protein